jgi:hypothetical protein
MSFSSFVSHRISTTAALWVTAEGPAGLYPRFVRQCRINVDLQALWLLLVAGCWLLAAGRWLYLLPIL